MAEDETPNPFHDINTEHGTLTYYKDGAGEHRARTVAKNSNKLVGTLEGYKRERDARQAMRRTYMILHAIYSKEVYENTGEPIEVPEPDDVEGTPI